jgi:hypothetical protein
MYLLIILTPLLRLDLIGMLFMFNALYLRYAQEGQSHSNRNYYPCNRNIEMLYVYLRHQNKDNERMSPLSNYYHGKW